LTVIPTKRTRWSTLRSICLKTFLLKNLSRTKRKLKSSSCKTKLKLKSKRRKLVSSKILTGKPRKSMT
jgi:hypothetical protein